MRGKCDDVGSPRYQVHICLHPSVVADMLRSSECVPKIHLVYLRYKWVAFDIVNLASGFLIFHVEQHRTI